MDYYCNKVHQYLSRRKNINFWVGHYDFLNDKLEYYNGKIKEEKTEEKKEEPKKTEKKEPDIINLAREYAKDNQHGGHMESLKHQLSSCGMYKPQGGKK
jgi:hypothetical protein